MNETPRPSRRSWRRIFLRFALAVLVLAAAAGVYVYSVSRTPLPAHPTQPPAEILDLDAFARGALQFPDAQWHPVDPEPLGWSTAHLDDARQWAEALDTSAVMVVHRGALVAAWGATSHRTNSQSIRKSLLSSLYGRQVTEGRLDLDATLAELGIDDHPPLTPAERQATLRHLLLARSGIYRPSIYEASGWKRRKPERGSAAPGEQWFYNNWDFNALGTIYEQAAGRPLDQAFADEIAAPTGMQDYRPRDVQWLYRDDFTERMQGNDSDHPAYVFMISARDLARFGLLVLADGRWDGQQILPPGWIQQSTIETAQPTGWDDLEYGFMWWVVRDSEIFGGPMLLARGGRGHRIYIVPHLDLVIVHRLPTGGVGLASQLFRRFVWRPSVDDSAIDELLRRIVAAHPQVQAGGSS